MDAIFVQYLEPILTSGWIIVLAALILGAVIKKWIANDSSEAKLIPTINTILGVVFGILLLDTFPDMGILHRAIMGGFCGFCASPIYDYLIKPWTAKFKGGRGVNAG